MFFCTHLLIDNLLSSAITILTYPRWSSNPFQGHSFTSKETAVSTRYWFHEILKKLNKKNNNTQNKQQIFIAVFFKESRPEKSHLKGGPAFVLHRGYLLQDRVEFSLKNWLVCLSLRTATESRGRLQSDKTKTGFLFQHRRAISTHLII